MLGLFTVIQDDFFYKAIFYIKQVLLHCMQNSICSGVLPAQKRLSGICVTLHLCGGINRAVQFQS